MEDKKAVAVVLSYYDCKIDMELMHDLLYRHFGSYKMAVSWLADNDNEIKYLHYGAC